MTRQTIEELTRRILDALPRGIADARSDLRDNVRAGIEGALSRLELVTRDEFDAQARVLARAREKLDALQTRVQALESATRRAGDGDG